MRRLLIVALMTLLCATLANAQLMMRNFGQGSQSSAPAVACGTGVIDLSAGCTITVILGLGP